MAFARMCKSCWSKYFQDNKNRQVITRAQRKIIKEQKEVDLKIKREEKLSLEKKCDYRNCNNITNKKYCSSRCKNIDGTFIHMTEKRIKAINLLGGKCSKCSYDKYTGALQFHHVNPSEKDFGLSKDAFTKSWETIQKEIEKCILLCGNCHAEEEHKLNFVEQEKQKEICKYKHCNNVIVGRQSNAEFCGIKCKQKEMHTRHRVVLKQRFVDYKGGKCEKCEYKVYIGSLHFHHTNPNEKDFNISKGCGKALKIVFEELDKCMCLCNNCHAEVHEELRNKQ
jgi:hypothetical protein